jgi:pyruvate dehydrogenase E1 component alpha subunit/2-oxoisovalerate dehydrogenase E1 component alpha subunit
MIEALTYRRGGHSSSDDPSQYRNPAEVTAWESNDPIERWRRYLVKRGLWTEALHDQYTREITDEMMGELKRVESVPPPALETLFDDVFAEIPPHLAEQKAALLAGPRPKPSHGGH